MSIVSKNILRAVITALAIGILSPDPRAVAQATVAVPQSVLPTGGGQALLDTSDTVLLLLNGGGRSTSFVLPEVKGRGVWEEIVNTARPGAPRVLKHRPLNLVAHSLVLLRFSAEPQQGPG